MPKLIVNPDTEAAWEIHLGVGLHSVGCSPENDVIIEHDSVAGSHCQLSVMDYGTVLTDLGSGSGTFVDDAPVEQSELASGQIIRLGDVLLRFEASAESVAETAAVSSRPCKYHPRDPATSTCPNCHQAFCDLCVSIRPVQGQTARFCRVCGVPCLALAGPPLPVLEETPSFASQLRGVFSYPLRGDGWIILLTGTVFFGVLDFVRSFLFLIAILISICATGYLVAFLQDVLRNSASGSGKMPSWPEFTGFDDLFSPFWQFFATAVFCFLPVLAVALFVPGEPIWLVIALVAAIVFGCIYFPMGFTAVTMFDSVGALNPALIVPSILRIPGAYLLAVVVLCVIVTTSWVGQAFLPEILPIPLVPQILAQFLGLYLAVVEVRILGLLYLTKRHQLGWSRSR